MQNESQKHWFLIDDDLDEQDIFIQAVNDVNPSIICSADKTAESALLMLRQSTKLPDIIFLDINMPKMDGFEFMIHLMNDARLKSIPVVFYSTTNDEEQIKKAMKLGALAFITKTNSFAELCKALKRFTTKSTQLERISLK